METQISVDNLKCGGCASTIKKQIKLINGVMDVNVRPDEGMVDITYDETLDMEKVKKRLFELGYPVAGSAQGIEKLTTNVKSYVSCAIGRFNKEEGKN